MSDLISRQAAIDALNEEYHGMISDESMKIYKIIEWLGDLPSAQPQRMKGRWYDGRCLRCGEHAPFHPMASAYYESNFCPNCGAWMLEEPYKEGQE